MIPRKSEHDFSTIHTISFWLTELPVCEYFNPHKGVLRININPTDNIKMSDLSYCGNRAINITYETEVERIRARILYRKLMDETHKPATVSVFGLDGYHFEDLRTGRKLTLTNEQINALGASK